MFEALRAWRRTRAKEQGVPPYVIFHDSTLREVAAAKPSTLSALSQIEGIGDTKLDRHGESLLGALGSAMENEHGACSLTNTTLVAGQIAPADVAALKAQGVTMIVNNRPDGEDDGQPTSAEIEAAARAAGIDYRHVPIARGMGPTDIEAMRDAMHAAGDGQDVRLSAAPAIARRWRGRWRRARMASAARELERCVGEAGFNLGPVSHLLRD